MVLLISPAFAAPSTSFGGVPLDTSVATAIVDRAGERYLGHSVCHSGADGHIVSGCVELTSEAPDGTVSVRRVSEEICTPGLIVAPCFGGQALKDRTIVTVTQVGGHVVSAGSYSLATNLFGMVDVLRWQIDRNLDDRSWSARIWDADGGVVFEEDHPAPMAAGWFDCSGLSDAELCDIIANGIENVHGALSDLALVPLTVLFSTISIELGFEGGSITLDTSAIPEAMRDALESAGAFASWSIETQCTTNPDWFRDHLCADPSGPNEPGPRGPHGYQPTGNGNGGNGECMEIGESCSILVESTETTWSWGGEPFARSCDETYAVGFIDANCICTDFYDTVTIEVACD